MKKRKNRLQVYLFLLVTTCVLSLGLGAEVTAASKLLAELGTNKIIHYSRLYLDDSDYLQALVNTDKGMHALHLFDLDGKELLSFESEIVGNGFRSVDLVYVKAYKKNVLVTVWKKGAHGTMIRLFDYAEKKPLLLERSSSWGTTFNILDGKLNIMQTGNMDKNGTPEEYNLLWPTK